MTTWTLEPRDTLVTRDGKPMDGASQMTSLSLPWPSSTAGFMRTRAGSDEHGRWSEALTSADAKKIPVLGPWVVELNGDGAVVDQLLPRPHDVIGWSSTGDASALDLVPLRPRTLAVEARTDLDEAQLQLLFPDEDHAGKPASLPTLVSWKAFYADWLLRPAKKTVPLGAMGIRGLEREWRTHVAIDAMKGTARDGALFSVEHLRFSIKGERRGEVRRLAIAVQCAHDGVKGGTWPWAGERRLSRLAKAGHAAPSLPKGIEDAVAQTGLVRVVLVTPAVFADGWKPGRLLEPAAGVTPSLVAAAVPRAEVVSGWDFALNMPKPTRRVAPAGSVYWLKLDGDERARRVGVNQWWWQAVSDSAEDALQGFGLCVLGAGGG